jgi:DNA excision repair protein ERCC-4
MSRWLLEYDSATFASYINTLQRQHFLAEKRSIGPARHIHDWFNAKAAATLVEASQSRVSRRSLTLDSESEPEAEARNGSVARDDFAEDEMALRDAEDIQRDNDESGVMDTISTQTQTIPQSQRPVDDDAIVEVDEDGEEMQEISEVAPPVFRPLAFAVEDNLEASVKRRLRKNHEVVLEEQPKWALLATILKEIEDTIARVTESHAGELSPLKAFANAELTFRSTREQHYSGHDRFGPNMPSTSTVLDHNGEDRPTIWS